MATVKDVAELARVSVATVSHVLTGRVFVSAELVERVRRAIEELDYRPNYQARNLRRKVTGLLGLVVPDNSNPFYAHVAKGVEDTAYEHGYVCILCNSNYDAARELAALDVLQGHQADGIILIPVGGGARALERLGARSTPVVVADRQAAGGAFDCARVDNWKGGYLAGRHLVELGHRQVAVIAHPDVDGMGHLRERTRGFVAALKDGGIPNPERQVNVGGRGYEAGRQVATEVLSADPRPSALFAYDDVTAIGAIRGARELGLRLPEDLSVVGFDDILPAAMCEPPLTTVGQHKYRLGQLACELLLERLSGEAPPEPREVLLDPELVVRESTAPSPFPLKGRGSVAHVVLGQTSKPESRSA